MAHSSRFIMAESQGNKNLKQVVNSHPQPGAESSHKCVHASVLPTFFIPYSSGSPEEGVVLPTIKASLPISVHLRQSLTDVSAGNSRFGQVDRANHHSTFVQGH